MIILVTGGAGFVGSHLVDKLLNKGHKVIVYDNLDSQVHKKFPDYLSEEVKYLIEDVRNKKQLSAAVRKADVVYHLAAKVGVGQSMYEIGSYIDVNTKGTAFLLDILVNEQTNVKKLIVASSMSTYGEGAYACSYCGRVNPDVRSDKQLKKHNWELYCPKCKRILEPIPTTEHKYQDCTSIYALSKKQQEKMCLLIGEHYNIPTTAFRFFNIYGSRQALSNPYTGACAIFSTSLLCGNSPIIFEDGLQTRDFVHVDDICQALLLSLEKDMTGVFNVGTGNPITIKKVAEVLSKEINPNISPIVTNKFRSGDIRHCYADISKIKSFGYKPKIKFEEGVNEFVDWVKKQKEVEDKSKKAIKELESKGILK